MASAASKVQHSLKSMQFFIPFNQTKKAVLDYRLLKGGKIVDMHHTEVPVELRGQGIAAKLCKEAFKYCQENQLKVVTTCPYVQKYVNETASESDKKLVVKQHGERHKDSI
ncbi:N-acetyltransferase domain-containing protein 1 [Aphelenchoides bicaudatus]|nr:N-acetyltransferase domain-containing protein 1 [Aphelenchoides bicaudatus]